MATLVIFIVTLSELLDYREANWYKLSRETTFQLPSLLNPPHERDDIQLPTSLVLSVHLEEQIKYPPLSPHDTHRDILVLPYPHLVIMGELKEGNFQMRLQTLLSIDRAIELHVAAKSGGSDDVAKSISSVQRMCSRLRWRKIKEIDDTVATSSSSVPSSHSFSVTYMRTMYIHIAREPPPPMSKDQPTLWHSPEDYIINITQNNLDGVENFGALTTIHAPTYRGVITALSSLTQLLSSNATVTLPLYLYDFPVHPWRGLLLDVARHFSPLDSIRSLIDGMEMVKLNVLHLHLTDSKVISRGSLIYISIYKTKNSKKCIDFCTL